MSSIFSVATGQNGNTNIGASGVDFAAQQADLQNPSTVQQANDQYNNAQSGIGNQIAFLNAVQNQNGLGNQTNVYNQLQGVVNGTGPNPAQAQLAQATQANTANTAALMAGQRGSSSNPGMIARQAAQQGAVNQQQAAGQAATLQAQQSLGALGQQGQMATSMANQQANATQGLVNATQNEQGLILNGIGGQNSAAVGNTGSQNQANSQLANTVAQGQTSLFGSMAGGIGSAFALAEGGYVPPKNSATDPGMESFLKPFTSQLAGGGPVTTELQPASGPKSTFGRAMAGFSAPPQQSGMTQAQQGGSQAGQVIGKVVGKGLKAGYNYFAGPSSSVPPITSQENYDMMKQYGDANMPNAAGVSPQQQFDTMQGTIQPEAEATPAAESGEGAEAGEGATAAEGAEGAEAAEAGEAATAAEAGEGAEAADLVALLSRGGKVPAMLSPGERYLSPNAVKKVAKGADPINEGKKVPGKAKVKGAKNSYANDTVSATLEEGGIVLPRSVTQSKHPHWEAHKFVSALMAKQGKHLPAKGKK